MSSNLPSNVLSDDHVEDIERKLIMSKTRAFALARYSIDMTKTQRILYLMSICAVSKNDALDNTEQEYTIDLKDLAERMQASNPRSFKKNMSDNSEKLLKQQPIISIFDGSDNWKHMATFASIASDPLNDYKLKVKFVPDFRRLLIKMSQYYDIQYELDSILNFSSSYSFALYDYFLGTISNLTPDGEWYEIRVTPLDLAKQISYGKSGGKESIETIHTGHLISRAIMPAIKDIESFSDLVIKDSDVVKIKGAKNKITELVFYISFKPGAFIPLVNISPKELPESVYNIDSNLSMVPSDDILVQELKKMGVNPSFIKSIMAQDKPRRVWRNILYTILHDYNPKYFNTAYVNDYGRNEDIETMARKVNEVYSWKMRQKNKLTNPIFQEKLKKYTGIE